MSTKGGPVFTFSCQGGAPCPPVSYATAHHGFTTVREMKYTSQDFCDKSMDDKMALYCEFCFPNCTQSW